MEVIIGVAIILSGFACPFVFARYRKYKKLWLSLANQRNDADEKIKFLSRKLVAAESFINKYGHISDAEEYVRDLKTKCEKDIATKIENAKAEAAAIRNKAKSEASSIIDASTETARQVLNTPRTVSPIPNISITKLNSNGLDDDAQPIAYFNASANADKSIEHLLGLCNGISSDQHLNDDEIHFLRNWISDNKTIIDKWPCNIIHDRITSILADGIITDEERLDLLDTLNGLLGSPVLNGVTSGMSTDLPITPDAEIIIPGSVFCLTGKFITGTRKKCEDMVLSGGGQTGSGVTLKTDYLVIGDLSSRDWKFSSFGRKIEKAIEYRDSGKSDVSIISEKMWLDALKNFGVI